MACLWTLRGAGLDVGVTHHPGYAPCGLYVHRIGDHAETDGRGWVYEVRRDGDWVRPSVGACGYPLREGDAVRWRYLEG